MCTQLTDSTYHETRLIECPEETWDLLLLGIHLLPFENNFTSFCSADWHFYNKQPRWHNHSQWSSWFWEWAALYFVCYCKGKPTTAIKFDVRSPTYEGDLSDYSWCPNQFLYWKRIRRLIIKICSLKSDVQIRQMLGRNSTSAKTVCQYSTSLHMLTGRIIHV